MQENKIENKEQVLKDIQYMKQIVDDSRKLVVDNGMDFIVVGILIILGLVLTYIDVITEGGPFIHIIWPVIAVIGWIFSIFRHYSEKKAKKASTFAGKLTTSTWLAAGISLTIIGMIGLFTNAYSSVFILPLGSIILGIAFYISAILYDSTLLKMTAPIWWLGSIYMFLFPSNEIVLIMAGMIFFLQLLPGIVFFYNFKQEKKQSG